MDKQALISDDEVRQVSEIVITGGQTALEWFRQPHLAADTENKAASGYDPVTAADKAVETGLSGSISTLFPNDAIVGEEHGSSGSGDRRWIIDPIDGTRAFIMGQPSWGVLVGLYQGDEPIAGWTYVPVLDELYVAVGGRSEVTFGASSDHPPTRPMVVSGQTSLADSILTCTHPSMFDPGPEQEGFLRVDSRVRMTRYGGDCLNWVLLADGSIDLVVENQLHTYDIASLVPLVEGAGGVISTLGGGPTVDAGYVIGAASQELMDTVMALLRQ